MSSADGGGDPRSLAFAWAILWLSLFGAAVNVACVCIMARKRPASLFHHLLKILAVYDLLVVSGCALLYSVPSLWLFYRLSLHPRVLPWTLPVVQVALMSSVYTTVVMSFERYIRIVHLCQLRECNYITRENFRYYVLAVIVLPILFYLPRFMEVRSQEVVIPYQVTVNCSDYVAFRGSHPGFQGLAQQSMLNFRSSLFPPECARLPFQSRYWKANGELDTAVWDSVVFNVTRQFRQIRIIPTALRRNRLYYSVYCIGLNTVFASLLPMASLLFLNVKTVAALSDMLKGEEAELRHPRGAPTPPGRSPRSPSARRGRGSRDVGARRGTVTLAVIRRLSRGNKAMVMRVSDEDERDLRESLQQQQQQLQQQQQQHSPAGTSTSSSSSRRATLVFGRSMSGNSNLEQQQQQQHQRQPRASIAGADAAQRRTERRLTRISLCIVWLFIFCHAWKLVPTLYEGFRWFAAAGGGSHEGEAASGDGGGGGGGPGKWPEWLSLVNDISHTLIVFNSAVNFLIYVCL